MIGSPEEGQRWYNLMALGVLGKMEGDALTRQGGTGGGPPSHLPAGRQSSQVKARSPEGARNLCRRKHVSKVISQYLCILVLSWIDLQKETRSSC